MSTRGRPLARGPQGQAVLGQRRHRPQLAAGRRRGPARAGAVATRPSQSPPSVRRSTRRTSSSGSLRPTEPVELVAVQRQTRARGSGGRCVSVGEHRAGPAPTRIAPEQGVDLVLVELVGDRRRHAVAGGGEALDDVGRDRLAAELPDHRAQLEARREAQPVVDGPDPAVEAEQAVAALAVGVVGEEVEGADRAQLVVEVGPALEQREVVLLEVGGDEQLERALAERARRGGPWAARRPSPSASDSCVGRHLAPVEAVGEVPQRPLAPARLVDRLRLVVAGAQRHEERGVRAPRHAALDLDLAVAQEPQGVGTRSTQFMRGQGCPSGSIGRPHQRHGGRPAATISLARAQNTAASPRVSSSRRPSLVDARIGLVVVLVDGDQLLEHDHDAVGVGVVGRAPIVPTHELGAGRPDGCRSSGRRAATVADGGQVGEEPLEVLGQRRRPAPSRT